MSPSEKPLYTLYKNKKRMLLPKVVTFFVLGTIFYVGVLLNIALLNLTASEETIAKTSALAFTLILITIGILISFHKTLSPYKFYKEVIAHGKNTISYTQIQNTEPKQDILDKIFSTYSITLKKEFHLRHISQELDMKTYIQQMIEYNQRNVTVPYS